MALDKQRLIYEMLKESKELYTAYNLAQEYRYFNELYKYSDAKEKLEELIDLFINEESEEIKRFGYLLINWKEEIINSFIRVDDWRLSNGKTERKNKEIKTLFEISYGFSNFPRTRNRIMYSVNTKNEDKITFKKESKYTNKRIQKPRGKYNKNRGETPLYFYS